MKIVPAHIEGARGMLKLSQLDLAKAAGVSEDTIRHFESGKTIPRAETIRLITDALDRRGIEFTNGDEPGVKLRPSKALIPT